MMQVGQDYQSPNGPAWIKPAAGAAAGGTVVLLAARRRRKRTARRQAEQAARSARGRAVELAGKVAKDRKLQTYAFAGLALLWFLFRVSELRQLRKLNRRIA